MPARLYRRPHSGSVTDLTVTRLSRRCACTQSAVTWKCSAMLVCTTVLPDCRALAETLVLERKAD